MLIYSLIYSLYILILTILYLYSLSPLYNKDYQMAVHTSDMRNCLHHTTVYFTKTHTLDMSYLVTI